MLHLDPRAPRTPRLPARRSGVLAQLAASAAVHLIGAGIAATIAGGPAPFARRPVDRDSEDCPPAIHHLVFLAPTSPLVGGGGGGGGNRQPGPIRRAQGVGADAITLRVGKPPRAVAIEAASPEVTEAPPLPSIVLDAIPLASGTLDQIGLPAAGVMWGTSRGPGSGGGVGTGIGTGIGPGRGPGLGPGSGGGTGGGAYVAGGTVSAPRLIKEVRPRYTKEAMLNRLQGTVVLEAVVTADGRTSQIRVVRSLDRGGLDEEAVAAVGQWRFDPGRLAGEPVSVLVTILLDFTIR